MPLSHLLLTLLICAAWSGNFLFAAISLKHFPPFLFTALRLALVLVCLLPFYKPIPRDQWRRLGIVGLLSGALHFSINFWALAMAGDLSSTAIALQSYVPMSALLAVVLLGEPLRPRVGVGIALAFGGVLLLGFDPLVLDAPLALALTLTAAFMLALGTTLSRSLRDISLVQFQTATAVVGVPVLLAISAVVEVDQLALLRDANRSHWFGVFYTGVIGSIVGHGFLYWLVQRHPVAEITPYLLLTPVFAMGLGVAFWGDHPGPKLLLGGALVLAGVVVVAWRRRGR